MLRDHGRRVADEQVGAVVLGDAAQEGGAAGAALGEDVGDEGGRGGLAVRARDGEAALPGRDLAEHLRALDHAVAVLPGIDELAQVGRNGGRIDHEGVLDLARDAVRLVFVVHDYAFGLQRVREVGRRAVVAGHIAALEFIIAGDGAHTDAAYPGSRCCRPRNCIP